MPPMKGNTMETCITNVC